MIEAQDLHKSFGHIEVLKGVSLSVARGEVICVIGPSGSGKSTLLRCLNWLEVPERGLIRIDGEPAYREQADGNLRLQAPRQIAAIRARIGMVFQAFNLFPHLNALENVMEAPVHVLKRPKPEARRGGARPARPGRPRRPRRPLSRGALGRPAAAGRDRARARHGPQGDAVRRGHERPRP